jgi:predicted RNA-binding protein with PIN domain
MPILIDGWNLIKDKSSVLKNQTPLAAAQALIGYLFTFQITHNDPILLILDSKKECLALHHRDSAKLQIIPTPNADSFIKKYVDRTAANQRRNIRVVSSDLDIYDFARHCQATVIKCSEFWRKLLKKSE